jgi:carbon monoxide dehydrogenase subunit G
LAITFSGEFDTPRTPEEVFDFLSDPNQFAPLLPDFQSMSMQDPTHFTVKVRVGVGNIRGTAEIKMELAEAVKPQRAQYKGQGTAVGSQVTVTAGFDLQPNGESTRVLWQGEAGVFGKLASMAGGMLEPLGRKNIQKLIDGLQKALSEPIAVAPSGGVTATPDTSTPSETPTMEAPGLNSMNTVEASGSPTNAEIPEKGASAPAQETNGDHNS